MIQMVETTKYDVIHFTQTIYKIFGCMIDVHFYRIDGNYNEKPYYEEWKKNNMIALPTEQVRSLDDCYEKMMEGKDNVSKSLSEQYGYDEKMANRLAKQYDSFYKARNETWAVDVFVIMDGKRLIGIADRVGDYRYHINSELPHTRSVSWVMDFPETDNRMPVAGEGYGELCVEISNEENLLYLYEKYFYENNKLGIK